MLTIADLVVQFQTKLDPVFQGIDKLGKKLDELAANDIEIKVRIDDSTKSDIQSIAEDLNQISTAVEEVSRVFVRGFDTVDGELGNVREQTEKFLQDLEDRLPKAIKTTGNLANLYLNRLVERSTPALLGNITGIATAVTLLVSKGFDLKKAFGFVLTPGGGVGGFVSGLAKVAPQLLSIATIGGIVLKLVNAGVNSFRELVSGTKISVFARAVKAIEAISNGLTKLNFKTQLFTAKFQFITASTILLGTLIGKISFGLSGLSALLLPIFAGFTAFGSLFRYFATRVSVILLKWRSNIGDGVAQTQLLSYYFRQLVGIIGAIAEHAEPIAKTIRQLGKNSVGKIIARSVKNLNDIRTTLMKIETTLANLISLLAGQLNPALAQTANNVKKVSQNAKSGRGPPLLQQIKSFATSGLFSALTTPLKGSAALGVEIAKGAGSLLVKSFAEGFVFAGKQLKQQTSGLWKPVVDGYRAGVAFVGNQIRGIFLATKIFQAVFAPDSTAYGFAKTAIAKTGRGLGVVLNASLAASFALLGRSAQMKAALKRLGSDLEATGLKTLGIRIGRILGGFIPAAIGDAFKTGSALFKTIGGGLKSGLGIGDQGKKLFQGAVGDLQGATGLINLFKKLGGPGFPAKPETKTQAVQQQAVQTEQKLVEAKQEEVAVTEKVEDVIQQKLIPAIQKAATGLQKVGTVATKAAQVTEQTIAKSADSGALKRIIGGFAGLQTGGGSGALQDLLRGEVGGKRTSRSKLTFALTDEYTKLIEIAKNAKSPLDLLNKLIDAIADDKKLVAFFQDAAKSMEIFRDDIATGVKPIREIAKALGASAPAFFKLIVALQSISDISKKGDLFAGLFKSVKDLNKVKAGAGDRFTEVFGAALRDVAKDPKLSKDSAAAAQAIIMRVKDFAKKEGLNLGDIFSAKGKTAKSVEASLEKRLQSLIGLSTGGDLAKGTEKLVKLIAASFSKLPKEVQTAIGGPGQFEKVIRQIVEPFDYHLKFQSPPKGLLGTVVRSFALMGTTVAGEMLKGVGGLRSGLRQYVQEGFGGFFQLVTDTFVAPLQIALNSVEGGIKLLGGAILAPIGAVKKLSAAFLSFIPIFGPALAGLSNLFFGLYEGIIDGVFKIAAFVPSVISKMLGQIGKGVKVAVNSIFELVRDTSEQIYSLALDVQRLGIGITQFDALRRTFRLFGVEATETAQAIQFLNQNIANTARGGSEVQATLALAGLTIDDVKSKDPAEIFFRISQAIQEVGSNSAVANRLLDLVGASFSNLRTVLVSGPDALLAALNKVDQGGFLITDREVQAAKNFQQLLISFNQKITDLKTIVLGELAPVIEKVRNFWEDYGPEYIAKVQAGIEALGRVAIAWVTEIVTFIKTRFFNAQGLENLKNDLRALGRFIVGVARVAFSTIFLFAAKKVRDLLVIAVEAVKSLNLGQVFSKVLSAITSGDLGSIFVNLGRQILAWIFEGISYAIPKALGELVKAVGNLLIEKLPSLFRGSAKKTFEEFIDGFTDLSAEFSGTNLIGKAIGFGAADQLKSDIGKIVANIGKALDDVKFESFGDAFAAAAKGVDAELQNLSKESEALASLFERLKALGESIPAEYEAALARVKERTEDLRKTLGDVRKDLDETKKKGLSYSQLLPLLAEFQDAQNQIVGNLGEYVEKIDPILIANQEWREGIVSLLNVFNDFNSARENLTKTFQQILTQSGAVSVSEAARLQKNLEIILAYPEQALNAFAEGDVEAADRIITNFGTTLDAFNSDVAGKLPGATAALARFQAVISPSFWEAVKLQMSGLVREIKVLDKVIESAENHADQLGIRLLNTATNARLFELDTKLLNEQIFIFGQKLNKEGEEAIRAFGAVFGFQFDENIATNKQLGQLRDFIEELVALGKVASKAAVALEKLGAFQQELEELFGGGLADAFNQSDLNATKFELTLEKTLATVKSLAKQNGGEIPDGVRKWLNISEDVEDVYAEIEKKAREINERLIEITKAQQFSDAYSKLDDVLSQGLDSEPLATFTNFQAAAERGAGRLAVQLNLARIETEKWFETLGSQDPGRFLDAVRAANTSGLISIPADIEINQESIPKLMEVLKDAIQNSIDTAISNEALRALRERVQQNVSQPLAQSIGSVLSGLADGSIAEAARSAREAAKAVGNSFSEALFIVSKLGQEIFSNYLDRFLTQITDIIEDGLTRSITAALTSKQVTGAVSELSEGMQRAIGLGITGLLAAVGLVLSRLQSQAEAVNDQIDSVINSTEAVRGVISGDTRVAIKETEDAFRASMQPVVQRLDIIIRLMQQGRGFGAPTSPLAGPTLTGI